jgi:hypothetical protein
MYRLLLAFLLIAPAAAAQHPQGAVTLTIERAGVRVDGRQVETSALPASLDLRRISERVFYTGPAGASFEIGGLRYRVEGRSIRLESDPRTAPDLVLDPPEEDFSTGGAFLFVPVAWVGAPDEEVAYRMSARQELVLDATALDLAAEMAAQPPGPARDALRERLRRLLHEAFEVKQANRAREIELIQSELDALRELHQQRQTHRQAIVESRLAQLEGSRQ